MHSANTSMPKSGRSSKREQAPSEETTSLLESGGISPKAIESYISSEADQPVDTSFPTFQIPEVGKEMFYFSNYGLGLEVLCSALLLALGVKYILSGCLLDGCSTIGLGVGVGWLCGPQLMLPFVSNPIIRWFTVTNHSHHATGLASALGAFVVISYFSWTNDCRSRSVPIQSATITLLTVMSLGVVVFLTAIYRDEKGNAGYLKWVFKLIL